LLTCQLERFEPDGKKNFSTFLRLVSAGNNPGNSVVAGEQ